MFLFIIYVFYFIFIELLSTRRIYVICELIVKFKTKKNLDSRARMRKRRIQSIDKLMPIGIGNYFYLKSQENK